MTDHPSVTSHPAPVLGSRLGTRDARGHSLHWVIAALLHVPLVYLLLALTVRDARQDSDDAQAIPEDEPAALRLPEAAATSGSRPSAAARITLPATVSPLRLVTGQPGEVPTSVERGNLPPNSALQRMIPATADARIMTRSDSVIPLAPIERARARLAERMAPVNDSIAAELRARERKDDMTVTDRNGNRWGLTRGALHLGSRTITLARATAGGPVPDVIVPPPGKRDEVNAQLRSWRDIEIQAGRALARGTFDQRAREMRQRSDSVRSHTLASANPQNRRD